MSGVERTICFGRGLWLGAALGLAVGTIVGACLVVQVTLAGGYGFQDFAASGGRFLAYPLTRLVPPGVMTGAALGGLLGYLGLVREAPGPALRAAAAAGLALAASAWLYALWRP